MAAADDVRMEGVGEDAEVGLHARHVGEVVDEVLQHVRGVHQPGHDRAVGQAHVFEVRVVVERPADRHLDQRRLAAAHERRLELGDVALAGEVAVVVVAHQRAVVLDAVLLQQLDRMRGEVPGRRAIAARQLAADALDRFIAADDFLLFLLARQRGGQAMRPAVMGKLVSRLDIGRDGLRRAVDRVAGREEGRLDAVALQQRDQPRDDHHVVLAARYGRRRRLPAGDEAGQMVVIEGEADDVARHAILLMLCRSYC